MTVEKIKEVRFMKCATMLRKQYGAKISHAYCEVDDTKGGSISFQVENWILKLPNLVKKVVIKNPSKVYTITDAYEVALQLGSVFIKREHVSMNSAVFGRLDFPSEICFVSISTIIWQYNMVDLLNKKVCERVSSYSWIFMKNLLYTRILFLSAIQN